MTTQGQIATADEVAAPGVQRNPDDRLLRRSIATLFAVHLLVRLFVFGSGYFYGDDYVLQGRAARFPLWSSDFLLYFHNGHLMPGGFLLAGIAERLAPFNYWVPLLFILLMQTVASALTVLLVLRLFGLRRLVLVPIGVALFSPLTLLPASWFSAAVNVLPLQAAIAGAGVAMVWLSRGGPKRGGRWVAGATVLAAHVGGLAFMEKGVLIPVSTVAIAWIISPVEASLGASLIGTLRRWWGLWLSMAAINVAYLAFYVSNATESVRAVSDSSQAVALGLTAVFQATLPALFGGPIAWDAVGSGTALAAPPGWFVLVASQVTLALIVFGSAKFRTARRAWIAFFVYLLLDVIALVLGRAGIGTANSLPLAFRYTVDCFPLGVVAIGASLMAIKAPTLSTVEAPENAAELAHNWRVPTWVRHRGWWLLGAIGYGYLLIAIISAARLVPPLQDNFSRTWITNLQVSLLDQTAPVPLFDAGVPKLVYDGLGYPHNLYSWLLAPMDEIEIVDRSAILKMIDDNGAIRDAKIEGISSVPGPAGQCNWPVTSGGAVVELQSNVIAWRYIMRIGYYVAEDTTSTAVLVIDGKPVDFAVSGGVGELFLDIEGGGQQIVFHPTTNDQTLCLEVTIGTATPR